MATEKLQRSLTRLRVPLGFLLGVICLAWANPKVWTVIAGAIVAAMGIFWRAWASGHLRKNERLATSGPYAHTRNPLYFGSLLLGVGFTLAAARLELVVMFTIFYLLVYWPVMRIEAEHMMKLFPQEYPHYSENVPLFWPRLTPWRESLVVSFDLQLYLKYREYRAFLGMVMAIGVLLVKVYWFSKIP